MSVILSGGKILGSGAGVFSIGSGGTLAAPANVNMFNQGGPALAIGNQAAVQTAVLGIQWDDVSGATGYDVQRVDAVTGATTSVATNVQPVSFTVTQSGTTLTVTGATAGTVLPGVRYSGLPSGTFINAPQLTGSGNGNGTYQANVSQTLGSTVCTANLFVDSTATNAVRPFFDSPATGYWYQVATRNGAGTGSFSTNMAIYQYQNGDSNNSRTDLSSGVTTNWISTNGSPPFPSGRCCEVSFNPGGGFQPTTNVMTTAQWTTCIQWAKYFFIWVNPGTNNAVQMLMGPPPCRTTEGDVFSYGGNVDLFSTSYGVPVTANTWSLRKVPCADIALGYNSVQGSISGSTLTVTAVSTDLFGNAGRVDNGGWVTGPGISVPAYVHASGQNGAIGTFTLWTGNPAPPDNGTPVSLSTSSTGLNWAFHRHDQYKFNIQPSGQPFASSVYFGDWGFSRT